MDALIMKMRVCLWECLELLVYVMDLEKQNCVQGMLLFFKATGMVK